jgi:hypothetical protein
MHELQHRGYVRSIAAVCRQMLVAVVHHMPATKAEMGGGAAAQVCCAGSGLSTTALMHIVNVFGCSYMYLHYFATYHPMHP